jgi:hypothetical protein
MIDDQRAVPPTLLCYFQSLTQNLLAFRPQSREHRYAFNKARLAVSGFIGLALPLSMRTEESWDVYIRSFSRRTPRRQAVTVAPRQMYSAQRDGYWLVYIFGHCTENDRPPGAQELLVRRRI